MEERLFYVSMLLYVCNSGIDRNKLTQLNYSKQTEASALSKIPESISASEFSYRVAQKVNHYQMIKNRIKSY